MFTKFSRLSGFSTPKLMLILTSKVKQGVGVQIDALDGA